MEFALSDEQRLLDESLRGLLGRELPIERLKALAKAGDGQSAALWQSLVELGLPAMLVPAEHGGAGLGVLDAAVAAEALGYAAAPVSFAASCVMAPLAVSLMADARQQAEWLPRMASGEMRVAIAFAGGTGQTGAAAAHLEYGRLSSRIDGAIDMTGATHLLTILPDGKAAMVPLGAAGVAVDVKPTLDRSRPIATISLESAAASVLDASNDPAGARRRVLAAGRVMLAADTLGAAQAMLDKAVAYAGERVQFGRTIASFQAVKHICAEMATDLDPCRAMVWYAAHAQDAVPEEAIQMAAHVKAHLAEVGRHVQTKATEVHGGMGFTELMGLELWYKRISLDRHLLGGPEHCRTEAAIAQGWVAP